MQSTPLAGRTEFVTGSSKGIGHAIAEALAEAGARVIVHGRNAAVLTCVAAALPCTDQRHGWIEGDLGGQKGRAKQGDASLTRSNRHLSQQCWD